MDNKKIGKKIAIQRNKLNLTQTALAEKLCVSPKTVSKWESGNGLPSIELLPELAKLFGISIDELLYKESDFSCDSKLKEINALAMFKILSPNYSKFPDQVREMLKDEWLSFILKEENLTMPEFYSLVNSHSKPKSIIDCADRLLTLENVSISKIQKKLRIGFSRAANIRESLIKNSMIDNSSFVWLNRDFEKLITLLTKELEGFSFKEDISPSKIDKKIDTDIDFKTINLINEDLSEDEKTEALLLLENCSVDFKHPGSPALFCLDRESVVNILSTTNNSFNVKVYKLDSLDNLLNKILFPYSKYSFVIIEAHQDTDIFNLMTVCDMKTPAEFALVINNNLGNEYKFTIFYI